MISYFILYYGMHDGDGDNDCNDLIENEQNKCGKMLLTVQ